MEWTPLDREDLERMIADGLAPMDDVVQAAWEAMCIEPEKWQCSPWGDQGGGFWAVAVKDGRVVWYNDIEDGFNISRFVNHGTIAEYICNQDTFGEMLLRLPEARAMESWRDADAAKVAPRDLKSGGTVTRRQTTYWELQSSEGLLWRLHFKGRSEVRFVEVKFAGLELADRHPILYQYVEPWQDIFFTGEPADPEAMKVSLSERIAAISNGWRTIDDYLNKGADLSKGYGLLMRAPSTIVSAARDVLAEAGLSVSILNIAKPKEQLRAIIGGKNAIVAKHFRFERRAA